MKIHVIETGKVAVKTRQREARGIGVVRLMNTLTDTHWTDPLPIYAFVIEHPEGIIVIDTGETARTAEPGYFPRWHPYYRFGVREWVTPEQEIGPQLRTIGIDPNDVRWVIMTHLHTDHAGGLAHFPNAEILVTRTEFELARGFGGKLRGYLPHRWPEWFSPTLVEFENTSIGPFPTSITLTKMDNVHLVPTPGHSGGHMAVILEEEHLSYFFAGDTSYTETLMLQQKLDGVAPDEDAARQSLARALHFVREQPTVYLPSHDPNSSVRLEEKRVAIAPLNVKQNLEVAAFT
jgi:glyoxylase-like metal-dependent hydrolase (beta-lactamase superfamily II)